MKTQSEPMNRLRQLPLAACLMAVLGSPHAPHANAAPARAPGPNAVLPVTSCADDGGPGTLRSVVATAVSGDTVDMTQLSCSTITLTSGTISILVNDLTLQGPGANALTLDGGGVDRVIGHGVGAGSNLTINDISISNGHTEAVRAQGGCVLSFGNVSLTRATISNCSVDGGSSKYAAAGGGLMANGDLTLTDSSLVDNTVSAIGGTYAASYGSLGGGAYVRGNALIIDSTISGNSVQAPTGTNGYRAYGGGIVAMQSLVVYNSTIAFNTADQRGGGVFRFASSADYGTDLQSTIVADNTVAYQGYSAADFGGYGTISGANNLIGTSDLTVPGDTLTADPQLQPLADNGGSTLTHALSPGSPAIDAGNNSATLAFDQRGDGYPRVSGLAADIGAFEYQQVFAAPTLTKTFAPDEILIEGISTLTITLGNTNAAAATLSADLVDNLPAPILIADPPDAQTTCLNGSVMANAGDSSVLLASGAGIPALGACTVTVSVAATDAVGTFTNTIPSGALQTDLGNNPDSAIADLTTVTATPGVTKEFVPEMIRVGDVSMLIITLINDNPLVMTLSTDLVDDLPALITIADPPNAATTCAGGSLDALPGSGTITLGADAQIPPNTACTITVATTAAIPGIFTNTIPIGALQTNFGDNADPGSADLTVTNAVPSDSIFTDGFDGHTPAPTAN